MNTAVAFLKSLLTFIQLKCDVFEEYERKGMDKSETRGYAQVHKRPPKRNVYITPLNYGRAQESVLFLRE